MGENIGQFDHPKHGIYYIFFDKSLGTYGLSKENKPIHCAYASLSAALSYKGL